MRFGYYLCPHDPTVIIPDPKKLDALHYAFRMKAKYNTPIRDCTQWLHAATGQRLTPAGFLYAYREWVRKIRGEHRQKVAAEKRKLLEAQQKVIADTYSQFGVSINDRADITAVATKQAKEEIKKERKAARQNS